MPKMTLGPPRGFPIGTAFLLGIVFVSFYETFMAGGQSALGLLARNLVVAAGLSFLVYILVGRFLQSIGQYPGGLVFALIVGFWTIVADQVLAFLGNFGFKISLIPLATIGGVNFSFQINGADQTWLLAVLAIGVLYFARYDLERWFKKDFSIPTQ